LAGQDEDPAHEVTPDEDQDRHDIMYRFPHKTRSALERAPPSCYSLRIMSKAVTKTRCQWAGSDPLYIAYHDKEWGTPVHDDRKLFEMLILEGAQAGLAWITILRKRENYIEAYDNFEPDKVAKYTARKKAQLLKNEGIVRNRLKVEASVGNAKAFLEVQKEFGSFDKYIWGFVGGKPIQNRFRKMSDLPASTDVSEAMCKDLKKRGFKFVGSTICYAFMQATGMVNDHTADCFRYKPLRERRR
jgi:DNA-3-methyladenine glycosylase I